MNLELDGSVIVITGGTDGLGLATARALVEAGADVAVCGRDEEKIERARAHLCDQRGAALVLRCDVTSPTDIETFAAAVVERFGRVDGLVNNAGKSAAMPAYEIDDERWHDDLDLKLFGAIRMIRAFLAPLSVRGGSIINVLAIAAKHPGAGSAPSSVSRAAGLAYTKVLSRDLAPRGIRVNAVLIGIVASGQWDRLAMVAGKDRAVLADELAQNLAIPLGRIGRSEEFADLATFLLSARASYITGCGINFDGGLSTAW